MERDVISMRRVALAVPLDPGRVALAIGVVVWVACVAAPFVAHVVAGAGYVARANGNSDRNPGLCCINLDAIATPIAVAKATGKSNPARGTKSLGPIRDTCGGLLNTHIGCYESVFRVPSPFPMVSGQVLHSAADEPCRLDGCSSVRPVSSL